MLKRTAPAVSFTTSHQALALKSSRMLLGHDMTSVERHKAAWDEMPWTTFFWSRKDQWNWDWRCRYELGIRCNYFTSKAKSYMAWSMVPMALLCLWDMQWPIFVLIATDKPPAFMQRDHGEEYAKKFGKEVWGADGKFIKPYYHINPPMLTMTADELN
jgi:hypothetical protein